MSEGLTSYLFAILQGMAVQAGSGASREELEPADRDQPAWSGRAADGAAENKYTERYEKLLTRAPALYIPVNTEVGDRKEDHPRRPENPGLAARSP